MKASVVITTRNRKEELRAAIQSVLTQTKTSELIVIDDGSTDGTSAMVEAEFPQARLIRHDQSRGLIVRRNEAARLATGDIIFSIDDDAQFDSPNTVEQTLSDISDPRIGAVAIPFIEPHKGNFLMQQSPDREQIWICQRFIGTAHAVRRELFLNLGGYREHLFHQGEEGDFCIRMLDAGYYVRLGNGNPILHFESPKRDSTRIDYYGSRNSILFVWQNVPWPAFPIHFIGTTYNVLRFTFKPGRFFRRLRAIIVGYMWCLMNFRERHPVRFSSYSMDRKLRRIGPIPLSKIEE